MKRVVAIPIGLIMAAAFALVLNGDIKESPKKIPVVEKYYLPSVK